jgi:hypothetical protein
MNYVHEVKHNVWPGLSPSSQRVTGTGLMADFSAFFGEFPLPLPPCFAYFAPHKAGPDGLLYLFEETPL